MASSNAYPMWGGQRMANQLVYNGRPMELETKRAVRAPIPKRNQLTDLEGFSTSSSLLRPRCNYESCCGTRRKKVGGLLCGICGIIFVVLMAIPGGIAIFLEPSFGDVSDFGDISLSPGFGSLTVTGNAKVQLVNDNIFPFTVNKLSLFLSKGTLRIDLDSPPDIVIGAKSSYFLSVSISVTFDSLGDAASIALVAGECLVGSSEFDLLGTVLGTYHIVTQERDFSGRVVDLGC